MSEREYRETNRRHWDEAVPIHVASSFYNVDEFRAHPDRLKPLELAEVGDVAGKSLLHLQCHFGMDTISWARRGAIVTGVDFSENAISQARRLAEETGTTARFLRSDLYDLPSVLHEQFDVVFTSYGVLCWLPDIPRWAHTAAGFVKPGGTFYIAEFHPFATVFDDRPDDLHVRYPYFPASAPLRDDEDGTYAEPGAHLVHRTTYQFPFTLGDVVTSLIQAGLQIEFLHEFPFSVAQFLPFTRQVTPHEVRLVTHDGSVPLMFSIRATRPVPNPGNT